MFSNRFSTWTLKKRKGCDLCNVSDQTCRLSFRPISLISSRIDSWISITGNLNSECLLIRHYFSPNHSFFHRFTNYSYTVIRVVIMSKYPYVLRWYSMVKCEWTFPITFSFMFLSSKPCEPYKYTPIFIFEHVSEIFWNSNFI